MKRIFAALLTILFAISSEAAFHGGTIPAQFVLPLKIGAGGWLVGIDINPDGTRLARTDTYGAYIWNGSTWEQLVTQSRMPASYFGYVGSGTSQVKYNGIAGNGGGVYEIASAPSNSNVIYMMVNGWIFKSTDKGITFSVTGTGAGTGFNSATTPVAMGSNGTSRQCGRKMAIDPINTSIVYAGTDTIGMFVTSNGGGSWSAVSGVPTGTGVINYNIAFDASSAPIGGATGTIYAATNGATAGVYVSTDAGATWSLTTSGPSTVCHLVVSQTGVVWAVDGANGGANGGLWRYASGTWAHLTAAGSSLHSVAVDPSDATHVVVGTTGGALLTTVNSSATTPSWTTATPIIRSASDVPWLAVVNENFMSNGDMIFDPVGCSGVGACTLVFGEGIGVWTTNPPNSSAQITWASQSAGIEQLVSRDVIAPSGIAVTGVSDRSTWYLSSPNTYPDNYVADYFNSFSLNVTWGLDYAVGTPTFMAGITGDINSTTNNNSGFSIDGGATWKPFNSYYQDVASSALANDGTGQAKITVSSTAGLSTWAAGSGTIVRVIPYNPTINSCSIGSLPNSGIRRYWPVTVSDSTHLILQGSVFSGLTTTCGRLLVYVDTNPLTSNNSLYNITNAVSNGGLVRLTVTSTSSANIIGSIVSVSGVVGTTEANGNWVISAQSGNSFDLYGSTFVHAYVSGGVAKKPIPPGGSIAVSTPSNMIMIGGNQDFPQCTTDGGLTWTEFAVGTGGWVNASFLNRRIIAADRTTPNTFYLYNSSTGTYVVTNCGAPTLQSATLISNGNFNATLKSVPNYAGHLFFAIGTQGSAGPAVLHPQGGALRRSTDGGVSYQAIATTAEPLQVGIGAIAPGSDYPTIYMVGWISNVYGVWRTTATLAQWASGSGTGTSVSWTKVADYPLGSMDGASAFGADQITWNKWYLGWGGSGFTYGQQNFLLKRDLDPASNDNDPMWLGKAA